MADGMFNSGGGSGGGGGGRSHFVYSETRRPRGPHDPGADLAGGLIGLAILVAIIVCAGVVSARATEAERELDATTYDVAARGNLATWSKARGYDVKKGTIWVEPGSSRRQSYHCKGGQLMTTAGENVTFCCSVEPAAAVPCLVISDP